MWNKLKERTGESLAILGGWPVKIFAILAVFGLIATVLTTAVYQPMFTWACRGANQNWFGGSVDTCRWPRAAGDLITNVLEQVSPPAGTGGSIEEIVVPQQALVLNQTNVPIIREQTGTGVTTTIEALIEEIEGGKEVVVVGYEVFVYKTPRQGIGNISAQWDVQGNPTVIAWAVLRVGDELWIRTTQKNHPSPNYMLLDVVENTNLPIPVPLVVLPQDPWGLLEYQGTPSEEIVTALAEWGLFRQNGTTISHGVLRTSDSLSSLGPNWARMHNDLANALVAVEIANTQLKGNENIQRVLEMLYKQDITLRVTHMARPGFIDTGKQLVRLQAEITLNGSSYDIGDSIEIPIKTLRRAGLEVIQGQPLGEIK
jgi:hypothetical protein